MPPNPQRKPMAQNEPNHRGFPGKKNKKKIKLLSFFRRQLGARV
jgi:hypothetical protein